MVTKELATMEILSVYHRWLRGVQALLSIVVFILSLLSIEGSEFSVNLTIFIISQAAILVICKTYEVKAQFSGLNNVLFEGKNIFTSPYFFHMAVEVVLWNIQTPPIVVFWKPFFGLINYFIYLRLYSVILYLNNAKYAYRTFCRAMSAISDLSLDTSFLLRTSLVYAKTRTVLFFSLLMWLTVSFMYSKAESVSVGDGMWFSFQTLATLGYGDYTPLTVAGRAVAFIAYTYSLFILSYLVIVSQHMMKDSSHNMQVLDSCHDLTHQLRSRSAWVIQVCYKFHRARREGAIKTGWKQKLKILLLSWKLTHVIAALRRTRQALNASSKTFRESSINSLTGLSAYQYNSYLYQVQLSARRLQRKKDVDRVYLSLRGRDVSASSLTREDVVEMLFPAGMTDEEGSLDGSFTLSPRTDHLATGGASPVVSHEEEILQLNKKVQELEKKCGQLADAINTFSALAATHPPSMAQSSV
ncbi:ion transport protein-like protein [Angomonas deanei]|nr:ion transport protein-like protein [Angomonas deanei]|eukprot:EPY26356.1 ion transport protein-like protein [Angomonas deanei]